MRSEIGGYLELERFSGSLYHGGALALSSGRACLSYVLQRRGIKKILLPDFLCDIVEQTCDVCGTARRYYPVGADLRPVIPEPAEDEWVYLADFYGQLSDEELRAYRARFPQMILDNAHAYFRPPLPGTDTLYTCRKFLGVADGGFLYTDLPETDLPEDQSHARMGFLLGRFEQPASLFFEEASRNNEMLGTEPKRMSPLTRNLLRAVDYDGVRKQREENFALLHEAFSARNLLQVKHTPGPYAYPLMLENGAEIRKKLIEKKIYVATLWPNVLRDQPSGSDAFRLASQILPLPCDQRYGAEEMRTVISAVESCR